VYQPDAVRIEGTEATQSQVIVVGPDDHALNAEDRVRAGEHGDDVVAGGAGQVGILGGWRIGLNGERLQPSQRRRLKSRLLEPAGQVGRGGVGAGSSRQPPAESVVGQESDVLHQLIGRGVLCPQLTGGADQGK